LMDAADAAELPIVEFFGRAVEDDRRHELFARAVTIAQDTALRDKRRALGGALAAGVMGDDAQIDEELLFMRAVDDVDEIHIRLLARMAARRPPTVVPGWSIYMITKEDRGLRVGVRALLGTLELHGLIEQVVVRGQIQAEGSAQDYYNITKQGHTFLKRLAENPDLECRCDHAADVGDTAPGPVGERSGSGMSPRTYGRRAALRCLFRPGWPGFRPRFMRGGSGRHAELAGELVERREDLWQRRMASRVLLVAVPPGWARTTVLDRLSEAAGPVTPRLP
jgi:hypothetical protein